MNNYRRLAALSVLRHLYDSKKNFFDILKEFIIDAIYTEKIHCFNATSIKSTLEKNYGIKVPETIIKSALTSISKNNTWCIKNNSEYTATLPDSEYSSLIKHKYDTKQPVYEKIFSDLIEYIDEKQNKELNQNEKEQAIKSFCSFLLNDANGSSYAKFISSFILDNEYNAEFINDIAEIREGVILYSGITYNDTPTEVGSWKNNLTIFLDHEILFHSYGLNGEIFQNYFNDFHKFVKEINIAKGKSIIRLRYFPETKDDVDAFFNTAEKIVCGEAVTKPGNTAMKEIVNGCTTASDVRQKYTLFYHFLETSGILLDDSFSFSEAKFPHNLIGQEVYETIYKDIGEKSASSLSILNKIQCMRGDLGKHNFYNAKYFFLTGTDATIKAAWHPLIINLESVPLVITLDWAINKFWFKLNKGFEGGNFPSSLQVIPKARVILSSIINKSVREQYNTYTNQYRDGKLNKETILALILDLSKNTINPEDISLRTIADNLDFLHRDSLEHLQAEQEEYRRKHDEQNKENTRLRLAIHDRDTQNLKFKSELIKKYNTELIELKSKIFDTKIQKQCADTWCKHAHTLLVSLFIVLITLFIYYTYIYFENTPWEKIEPMLSKYHIIFYIIVTFLTTIGVKFAYPNKIYQLLVKAIYNLIYKIFNYTDEQRILLESKAEDVRRKIEELT